MSNLDDPNTTEYLENRPDPKSPKMTRQPTVHWNPKKQRWMSWVRMPDGSRRKVERIDKAKAVDDLNELLAIRDGAMPDRARRTRQMTFSDVLSRWIADGCPAIAGPSTRIRHRQPKAETTLDKIEGIVAKWLEPDLGNLRVDRTSTERIEKLFETMDSMQKASSTIHRVWIYLNMALSHAKRRGLIVTNPASDVMLPQKRQSLRPRKSLTREQVGTLIFETIPRDERPALWLTGLMCGLRPGELVGLRWCNVDLDSDLPTVNICERAHFRRSRYEGQRPPKRNSIRVLQLHSLTVSSLVQHRETLQLLGRYNPEGLVFPTRNGTPIGFTALRIYMRRLFDSAGLGVDWTTYELRHSFVSLADDALEDLRKVADMVGHTQTTTTLGYRHSVRDSIPHGVDAWNKLLGRTT